MNNLNITSYDKCNISLGSGACRFWLFVACSSRLTEASPFHKLYFLCHNQLFPQQNNDHGRQAQRVCLTLSAAYTNYGYKHVRAKKIDSAVSKEEPPTFSTILRE